MSSSGLKAGAKQRWVWAAFGATLVAAGFAALLSLTVLRPPVPPAVKARFRPSIEMAERRENTALDDEATLLDPEPLFQPTRWSTAQVKVDRPELGGSFQSAPAPAKLSFADTDLRLSQVERVNASDKSLTAIKIQTSLELPEPVLAPARPQDVLSEGMPGAILVGFGRVDDPVEALPERGPLIGIVEVGGGLAALRPQELAGIQAELAQARPPATRPWQAMEFLAAVDAAGLTAPLTITKRSGVEEVDTYFKNLLVRTLRIGERLAPGFYRISVGP